LISGNGGFSVPTLWGFALHRCLARSRSSGPICGSWSIFFAYHFWAPNQQLKTKGAVSGSRDLADVIRDRLTTCRHFFLFCLQYIDILEGSANMTDAIDAPPLAPILMAPAIPVDSTPAASLDSQKNDTNSPSSKPNPLLRLPPELTFYVSRTDDTLLRLNKYAPTGSP
jgi:hypothetical protein